MTPNTCNVNSKYYFAYGGNTNPNHMRRSYPNAKYVGKACLPNFKVIFQSTDWYTNTHSTNLIEDAYCNIIYNAGGSVYGILYELSEEDIVKLDAQERVPCLYTKYAIPELNAFTYVMNTDNYRESIPSLRYYNVVSYGYKYYELPLSQIEIIIL